MYHVQGSITRVDLSLVRQLHVYVGQKADRQSIKAYFAMQYNIVIVRPGHLLATFSTNLADSPLPSRPGRKMEV